MFIEGVSHVLPNLRFYIELRAFLIDNANDSLFLVDKLNGAQCAVHPAFVLIVLDEDNLRSWLEQELFRGRER